MNARANQLFTCKSRPATSGSAGDGFFTVVGGYEILVVEQKTGRPVTGWMVVAANERDLNDQLEAMLDRFAPRWLAQSPAEKARNMKIAKETALSDGWLKGGLKNV